MKGGVRPGRLTGGHDLLVKMYAPSWEKFGDLVPDRLPMVPRIRDTR